MQTALFDAELTAAYTLSPSQIDQYRRDGFIKLKQVFTPELLACFGHAIEVMVHKMNKQETPLAERTTYDKAFLQIANIWEQNETVKTFVMATRLGRIAAELMGVEGVRMYHDQALFKEPGGGFTPWHADQFYWPLSNSNSITAWIPLQETPLEMGPLAFCVGSHKILANRDLAISDESEQKIERSLKAYPKAESAYELGEVSFHAGWTFHRAGPNATDQMRGVMTVIMMEDGIRLIAPERRQHESDAQRWCPGVEIGDVIDSPLNPVIYSRVRDD